MTPTGWVLHFPAGDEDEGYISRIERFSTFTFVVRAGPNTTPTGLCLVMIDDRDVPDQESASVNYLALANPGRRVASFERVVRLSAFVGFEPLPFADVLGSLPSELRPYLNINRPIPTVTWATTLEILRDARPSIAADIERLQRAIVGDIRYTSEISETLTAEKDAIALALDISGLYRTPVISWTASAEPAPFIQGLSRAVLREDQIIQHDTSVFGDWDRIGQYQVGTVVFERRGQRLTVMNVNRTPIETTLGVDLVYYTHRYDSHVLVQYKRFRSEGDEWTYRPDSDRSFTNELRRMERLKAAEWDGSPISYRLNADPCFIKLSKPETLTPLSSSLIPGAYISLSLWKALMSSPSTKGPQGGTVIKHGEMERYMNNTNFVDLVGGGWIGSNSLSSRAIETAIREGLADGRSMVLAAHVPSD